MYLNKTRTIILKKAKQEQHLIKQGQRPKCVKNHPCDVIKMREMRGEVDKKTPKKEMDNPSFL